MQGNDHSGHMLHVLYTPTARYSVGVMTEQMRGDERSMHTLHVNYLARRWNLPGAQGNIYLKSGMGIAENNKNAEGAVWAGAAADYETRRIFISWEGRLIDAGNVEQAAMQKARVGFAPYEGDYEDLNTWLMLELDHHPREEKTFVATPLVRFFKRNMLWEVGMTFDRDLLFNWEIRF